MKNLKTFEQFFNEDLEMDDDYKDEFLNDEYDMLPLSNEEDELDEEEMAKRTKEKMGPISEG